MGGDHRWRSRSVSSSCSHPFTSRFLSLPPLAFPPGYARVILAGFSLVVMPYHPKLCTAVYFVSSILDVADGQAARRLNQTSKFGGVLDVRGTRSSLAPVSKSRRANADTSLVSLCPTPDGHRPVCSLHFLQVSRRLVRTDIVSLSSTQMRNGLPPLLPRHGVPPLGASLPVPYHARLCEPLHAHVQVRRVVSGWGKRKKSMTDA